MQHKAGNRGFTLVELAIVLAVVALVAALAAAKHASFAGNARITLARKEMQGIRGACGGFLADMERLPGFSPAYLRVANLLAATNLYALGGRRADIESTAWADLHRAPAAAFASWDEDLSRGWRGPYLLSGGAAAPADAFPEPDARRDASDATFAERGFYPRTTRLSLPADYLPDRPWGFPGEPALLDPWGDPYVLQIPPAQAFVNASGGLADVGETERFRYSRIVSAGPDGILSTPCFYANTNETGSVWGPDQRRASIFAGRPEDRGDDLVLFLFREDAYHAEYAHEGDPR